MQAKNVPADLQGKEGYESIWTWTGIDADSKLIVSWLASDRSQEACDAFIKDLASRTMMRLQISSDGLPLYIDAITAAFRLCEADYGQVVKTYAGSKPPSDVSPNSAASRYSPGRLKSVEKHVVFGQPFDKHISTSFMERWNLTLRMQNRRFTRLTNAFSKKFEMHRHMLAITVVFYNYCHTHKSLGGKTPAMASHLRTTAGRLPVC